MESIDSISDGACLIHEHQKPANDLRNIHYGPHFHTVLFFGNRETSGIDLLVIFDKLSSLQEPYPNKEETLKKLLSPPGWTHFFLNTNRDA